MGLVNVGNQHMQLELQVLFILMLMNRFAQILKKLPHMHMTTCAYSLSGKSLTLGPLAVANFSNVH